MFPVRSVDGGVDGDVGEDGEHHATHPYYHHDQLS